mmetsp:Transcript_28602/g.91175  ORF Transcript_28602/g.91175 Transcript_28602/m.91175 type:complete len:88 (-) Transcript_28602:1977-2240(-)
MWNLLCCCFGRRDDRDGGLLGRGQWTDLDEAEAREARAKAAEMAEARQAQFDNSALGKAAKKSVRAAKATPVASSSATGATLDDWRN